MMMMKKKKKKKASRVRRIGSTWRSAWHGQLRTESDTAQVTCRERTAPRERRGNERKKTIFSLFFSFF
jgi:hypothetical protein